MSRSQANFELQQLVELLSVVSTFTEEASATRAAIECAAAMLEAEVAAVVNDGAVVASVGFPSGAVPVAELVRAAREQVATVSVPGVGDCWVATARLSRSADDGFLVLARSGETGFSVPESNLIRGMARVLKLTMTMLQTLEAERSMHHKSQAQAEENAQLLHALQLRTRLIEKLHGIRRSITRRGSLPNIFEMIVTGVHELLADDAAVVSLWLLDPAAPESLVLAHAAGTSPARDQLPQRTSLDAAGVAGTAVGREGPVAEPGRPWSLATAVHQKGKPAGSLMLTAERPGDTPTDADHEILAAFAEHVSLALSDAKTSDDMHAAFHDSLTGLASRRLFLDRVRQALAVAESEPPQIALLFVDLDHFKNINDTLGHAAGDAVLVVGADRLRGCLRDEDVAARLGGDEFAVMLQGVADQATATEVAAAIITAVNKPIRSADAQFPGGQVLVSASIGISFSGPGSQDIGELLRQADVAMYRAKRNGRGRYEVFVPGMDPLLAGLVSVPSQALG